MTTNDHQVDALFSPWDKPNSPGCALAVIKDGQIIHQRSYGHATLEYDVPITPSTIFHVASVSKQFTAFAVALLACAGRLSLDDDARRYVPELPDFGHTITLRHMIHHTSGLRDQWSLLVAAGWRMSDVITTSDILDLVQRQRELNFEPGAEYAYCNTGYTLLALAVERVSGKPFREYCAEHIFQPLGMRHTHFHDDCQMVVPNRAYSYIPSGDGTFRNAVLSYSNAGATSLFTTVEDLALWDRNFYDARVGGPAVIELIHTRGTLNDGTAIPYAFGLAHGEYRGLRVVEHAGSDAGFRSMLTRFPDQHFTVAILGNVSDIDGSKLVRQIADIYLADQFTDAAKPVEKPEQPAGTALMPDDLARLAGLYYSAQTSETMRLEATDGKLTLAVGPGLELMPESPQRVHLSVAPDVVFTFDMTPAGKQQVHQSYGSGKPIIYDAVAPAHPTTGECAEYVGEYYSQELGVTYAITLRDDQLFLHQPKYGDTLLRPTFADAFKCDLTAALGFPTSMDLILQREGHRVTGFKISAGRIRNVGFTKV